MEIGSLVRQLSTAQLIWDDGDLEKVGDRLGVAINLDVLEQNMQRVTSERVMSPYFFADDAEKVIASTALSQRLGGDIAYYPMNGRRSVTITYNGPRAEENIRLAMAYATLAQGGTHLANAQIKVDGDKATASGVPIVLTQLL